MLPQLGHQLGAALAPPLKADKRDDALPFELIGAANHRGFGHSRVTHQRRFNFHRAQTVARDVDHIVNAAHHPEVAIAITAGPITGEVDRAAISSTQVFPIAAAEAIGISMHRAHHSRPGPAHHQEATLIGTSRLTGGIHHIGSNSRQGKGCRSRLGGRRPGQGADHHATGFGLPPGVDDRATVGADDIAIPDPSLRIDRLSHRAEDAQGAHVVAIGHRTATLHEGPDRRGCCVEERDFVFLDQLPERTWLGGSWRTLVHHGGGAIGKRAVNDVAMAGDPPHIGGAPVHVVFLEIKDPAEGEVGPEVVASRGVNHPFGLAG